MSNNPILILQMQRMGDLVLSFPMASWLKSLHSNTPVWIVGERVFFDGLVALSPPVTYFSYSDAQALEAQEYSMVVNLSHRREAAALAGRLKSPELIGPYIDGNGNLRVNGEWQLYRSSISHNNRHNLFHWADLNAMDTVPPVSMRMTSWPPVKEKKTGNDPRIGLFVGASEPDKRPDPAFWAELARKLMTSGSKPVFLGGMKDAALAAEAALILKAPAINLSGHFSITQLCRFIADLDLLIVPDTGPMHIAAWTGVPVLNLSIGPVNPWETGPFAPGHHILRPPLSCTGCWACTQKSVICKERLSAEQVAVIAELVLERDSAKITRLDSSAGHIYKTRRDEYGLFDMEPLNSGKERPELRHSIAMYWKMFFGIELGFIKKDAQSAVRLNICAAAMFNNGLEAALTNSGQKILMSLSRAIQGRGGDDFKADDFWRSFPPVMRPLSSYIQFILHNGSFSRPALARALALAEACISSLRRV